MNQSIIEKYPVVMRLLHWGMAIIIVGLVCVGVYMADLPKEDPNKFMLYPWHKSFGVLILWLVILRVVVRSGSRIPELPSAFSDHEKKMIHGGHGLLYLLMILTPIAGYLMSCSVGAGVKFFGIPLPMVIGKNKAVFELMSELHEVLAWTLIIVAGVHALAAIKHVFDKNKERNILNRMR